MNIDTKYTLKDIKTLTFVGDLHLNYATPQSRIDSYSEVSLNKFKQICDICESKNYKEVILLGDIFHQNQQTISYVNKVLEILMDFRDRGINLYTVIGNHDLSFNRLDYLDKSPLSTLFCSGLVRPLRLLDISTSVGYKVQVRGFHYPEKIKPVEVKEGIMNICVSHRFYQYKFDKNSLTKKNIDKLGYNIYVLGHDHVGHKIRKIGGSYLVRPGSILRATSHDYNLEREVYINSTVFSGSKDKPKLSFVKDKLNIKDPKYTFSASVMDDKNSSSGDLDLVDISEKVDDLLSQMSNVSQEISIYDVMGEMDMEDEVKDRIEMYLQNYGIYK